MNLERCSTYDANNLPFVDNLGESMENAQRNGDLVLFIHFADETLQNFAIECFTVQELRERIHALENQNVFRLFYTGVNIDKNNLIEDLDTGWRLFLILPAALRARHNGIVDTVRMGTNMFFEAEGRRENFREVILNFVNEEHALNEEDEDDDGGVADVINLARNVQAARRMNNALVERARETIRMLEGENLLPLLRQINDNDIALLNNAIQQNREGELDRLIIRIRRRLDDPNFLQNVMRQQEEVEDLRVRGVRAIEIVERENLRLPVRNIRAENNREFKNNIEEIFTEIANVGFVRWLENEANIERMNRISEITNEILEREEIGERLEINRDLRININQLENRIRNNPHVQDYYNVMDIYNDIEDLLRQHIGDENRLREVEQQLERLLRDINFELARLRI